MAQVHADPDKLREFAKVLTRSAEQYEQIAKGVRKSLAATGWNDSEQAKMQSAIDQTLRNIQRFSDQLKGEYSSTVRKKAAALDQFRR